MLDHLQDSLLFRIPLLQPVVLVPALVGAVGLFVVLLAVRRRRSRDRVRLLVRAVVASGAGLVGLAACWWFGDVQDVFGVELTLATRGWVAFASAGVGLAVVVLVQGRAVLRGVAVVAVPVIVLGGALGVNADFGAFRNVGQVLVDNPFPRGSLGAERGVPATAPPPQVDAAGWRAPADMPTVGRIVSVTIPPTRSGFRARTANVYLPPAALTPTPPVLPVVLSFSGQPGSPADLFTVGGMQGVLDAYARDHHGLAPIVVAPDVLGAPGRNPMCVDSATYGRVRTYIEHDTVAWIREHLRVPRSGWGVVGFSSGGTCAMQVVAGAPEQFRGVVDVAGELEGHDGDHAHTLAAGFGGSEAAWRAATPRALLRANGPYPDHLAVFSWGGSDTRFARAGVALAAAARAAGMTVVTDVSPGTAHDWKTVRFGLVAGVPRLADHLGLAPAVGSPGAHAEPDPGPLP